MMHADKPGRLAAGVVRIQQTLLDSVPVHSRVGAPLRVHGRTIGTLLLGRDRAAQPAFTADVQSPVQELSGNARLFKQLEQELAERQRVEAALRATLAPELSAPYTNGTTMPRILLAEDNQANIDVMLDYLDARGFAVTVARDGFEAIRAITAAQPDLVLMDIQMPGMDGIEATRRIRAEPSLRGLPIIALTALAMPGDRERCLQAGADEYLTKPVDLRALNTLIQSLLQRRGIRA